MLSIQTIRGFPFPINPQVTSKNIEDTLDYIPNDGDIILASYPKTGTTFLQYIIFQIVSKGEFFPTFGESIFKYAPQLEATGIDILKNLEKPRIYKHHYPYSMVQKNDKAKYIYIYRNPEDTLVSNYHFSLSMTTKPQTLEEFFEDFINGKIRYGSYFDHVLSYFAHKDDKNILLVSYEKLLLNKQEEVLKIAKYLGEEYFQILIENKSVMEKILINTSFENMKKKLSSTVPREVFEDKNFNFFRKGVIGDGKESLSEDQKNRLKAMACSQMKGIDLVKEWFKE